MKFEELMIFLKTITNSIYSPSFYSSIPQKPFFSALSYFLLLALLLTAIRSTPPILGFLTVGQNELKIFINQLANAYPSDLEVKVQNGKVTSNVSQPYFIPFPNNQSRTPKDIYNLVVIDTKTPFSSSQFNQYKALVWVAKDTVFVREGKKAEIKTIELSQLSDLTINKTYIDSLIVKISPWLNLITPMVIIGILLGSYMIYSGRLFYLLFLAILIWLLTKVIKKPLTYGEAYKVGLYSMTLGLLAELVFNWLNFSGFPFMFTIISLSVVTANMLSKKDNSVPKDYLGAPV